MSTADAWAVILAAGRGERLARTSGTRKQYLRHLGRPLFWHSARAFSRVAAVRGLVFVFPAQDLEAMRAEVEDLFAAEDLGLPWLAAAGGERRQDSVRLGIAALPRECGSVLVHDAARPFVSARVVLEVVRALEAGAKAAIPALKIKDTIKRVKNDLVCETPGREDLVAVQTPQGFKRDLLVRAHALAQEQGWEVTDDASLVERMGEPVLVVPGEEANVKITTPEDLARLNQARPAAPCVGLGYDAHRYGPGRPLVLGGIPIPNGPRVQAHSDGDVLLHALTDALLGCAGAGDIGLLFPDTDPAFEAMSSSIFVKEALARAQEAGLKIVHADLTVVAQTPKIAPWREQIAENVAGLLGLERGQVNVKATTEEGLGFTGEKKGLKAYALVTAVRERPAGDRA